VRFDRLFEFAAAAGVQLPPPVRQDRANVENLDTALRTLTSPASAPAVFSEVADSLIGNPGASVEPVLRHEEEVRRFETRAALLRAASTRAANQLEVTVANFLR
jgi:hypothetical protein